MSINTAVEIRINDPLQYLTPLPYTERFYPLGFPTDIASNSREVLEAAHESWGVYQSRFDRPPVRLHAIVGESGGSVPPAPVLRGQRNLMVWMADQNNFSVCDWRQRFGFCSVTRAAVADHVYFRWHYLEAIVLTLQELNFYTALHAACVAQGDRGVLLYGESGVGKSSLSYACAKRGWTYVSDDASSVLRHDNRTVIGEPHHFRFREDAPEIFPELRGLTVGRQLDHKPTIEVFTAGLPIRTAAECRADRIVFVSRGAFSRATLTRITRDEAEERLRQDLVSFDPDLEDQRVRTIASIADLPAFELRYANCADAVDLLEHKLC